MSYNFSEIANLLLAIFLAPIVVTSGRRLHFAGKAWFGIGLAFVASAYVLTIVEGFVLPALLNFGEHGALAIGSVLMCVGLWRFRASMREDPDGPAR